MRVWAIFAHSQHQFGEYSENGSSGGRRRGLRAHRCRKTNFPHGINLLPMRATGGSGGDLPAVTRHCGIRNSPSQARTAMIRFIKAPDCRLTPGPDPPGLAEPTSSSLPSRAITRAVPQGQALHAKRPLPTAWPSLTQSCSGVQSSASCTHVLPRPVRHRPVRSQRLRRRSDRRCAL